MLKASLVPKSSFLCIKAIEPVINNYKLHSKELEVEFALAKQFIHSYEEEELKSWKKKESLSMK